MSSESDGEVIRELRDTVRRLDERLTSLETCLNPIPPRPTPAAPPPTNDSVEALAKLTGLGDRPSPQTVAAKIAPPLSHSPRPPSRSGKSLEDHIGKAWTSWVGGILVLGAVLFFLKYAWDQGWIDPTPAVRIMAASAVGVAMVGLGQWMHIKRMRALAASLVGCGLAVLMGTMFAANILFNPPVLERETAFIMVVIVGGAGIAFSLQMRTMSLAILALLGMYLSPAILNSGEDQSLTLIVYLTVVTLTGLWVSFFKRNWPAVRILAFVCNWIWLIAWSADLSYKHGLLGTIACAGFFAMFLAELVASLHRAINPPADTIEPFPTNTLRLEKGAAILTFFNTTLAMCMFAIISYHDAELAPLWSLALALAGVMAVLTFATRSKFFSLSAAIQSMALLAITIPLYFEYSAITFAWATLGLALGIYTRFTNSKFTRAWMLIMLVLVVIRLWGFDADNERLQKTLFTLGNESFTPWMLMSWGAAIYALALAWLGVREPVDSKDRDESTGSTLLAFCAVVGTLVCATAARKLHPYAFTLTATIWTLGLLTWNHFAISEKYRKPANIIVLILLTLISTRWILLEGLVRGIVEPMAYHGDDGLLPPLLNLFILSGILLAAGAYFSQLLRKQNPVAQIWWIVILAFVALNVEAIRCIDYWPPQEVKLFILKNATLSVLWGAVGLVGILIGFRKRLPAVRWTALVLLGITAMKVLLVDMSNAQTIFRVLSFIVLGIVLLLVSFVYHKKLRTNATGEETKV
ncbi:MAG: DUF2339 domain-containing protein [Phycisphaerales bacterium]|nr:DUF2339 domain-containing protein [Phycisphaerales bacterium]